MNIQFTITFVIFLGSGTMRRKKLLAALSQVFFVFWLFKDCLCVVSYSHWLRTVLSAIMSRLCLHACFVVALILVCRHSVMLFC